MTSVARSFAIALLVLASLFVGVAAAPTAEAQQDSGGSSEGRDCEAPADDGIEDAAYSNAEACIINEDITEAQKAYDEAEEALAKAEDRGSYNTYEYEDRLDAAEGERQELSAELIEARVDLIENRESDTVSALEQDLEALDELADYADEWVIDSYVQDTAVDTVEDATAETKTKLEAAEAEEAVTGGGSESEGTTPETAKSTSAAPAAGSGSRSGSDGSNGGDSNGGGSGDNSPPPEPEGALPSAPSDINLGSLVTILLIAIGAAALTIRRVVLSGGVVSALKQSFGPLMASKPKTPEPNDEPPPKAPEPGPEPSLPEPPEDLHGDAREVADNAPATPPERQPSPEPEPPASEPPSRPMPPRTPKPGERSGKGNREEDDASSESLDEMFGFGESDKDDDQDGGSS